MLKNTLLSSVASPKQRIVYAKADSAASDNYFREEDANILYNISQATSRPITLPNDATITATKKGIIPLAPELSNEGKLAKILPGLKTASLISVGKLCDDGCEVKFNDKIMIAEKNDKIILTGYRNRRDGLYDIPIAKTTMQMDHFESPQPHAAIYTAMHKKMMTPCKQNTSRKKPNISNSLAPDLQSLHILAHDNEFDQTIEHALKQDKAQFQKINKIIDHPSLSVIIRKDETKKELAQYLHAACFSPVTSTWTRAIQNTHFSTWPGLCVELIKKYLPTSTATAQSHIKRERQGLQSTTNRQTKYEKKMQELKLKLEAIRSQQRDNETLEDALKRDIQADAFPASPTPNVKCNDVAYAVIDPDTLSNAYFDMTGKFPRRSTRGNNYIMIGYHYDANTILAQPMRDRSAASMTAVWKHLHDKYKRAAVAPNIYILDNEFSNELRQAMMKEDIDFQLVPPHSHRNNQAERAIQTFKAHFKAGLATCDPNFPISEWDRLLDQCNITLNLLRSSRANPKLSAWAYLFGEFNFNATPLAPPGTKIIAHKDKNVRGSWDLNGEQGWYVGPALDHYRCITAYFPRSRRTRICDTVTFIPHSVPFPKVTLTDHLKQAATDIVTLLTQPPSTTVPTLQAGDPTRNALLELATQLKRVDKIPEDYTAATPRVPNAPQSFLTPRVPNAPQSLLSPRVPSAQKTKMHLASPSSTHSKSSKDTPHRYNLRSLHRSMPRSFKSRAAEYLVAQQIFEEYNHHINHVYNINGKRETIDSVCRGEDKAIWLQSLSNEWGRLAQGNDSGVQFNDVIDFISQQEVPRDRDVTYATYVLDYRPLKTQPHRVRITVGGDRLSYPDDAGAPATNLLETKVLLNSVISDARKGARFMSADVKDFFLNSPMQRPEYMKVHYKHIPADIRQRYNLDKKVTASGHIYIKIKKGMYGLKQAAILAYQHLKSTLEPYGYYPVTGTVGLWAHKTRSICFCLCVDDFGVKYFNKADVDHLLGAVGKLYTYTTDWTGQNYCGMTLDWEYQKGYVDISMPDYVLSSIQKLQYTPKTPQFSPHKYNHFKYAEKGQRQYTKDPDTSPPLSAKETTWIQSVAGTFLYYARTIDNTLLPALNELARDQSSPTELTRKKAHQIMDYAATFPNTYVRYYASDMMLQVDSDAAYLVQPQAKSRIAGYFQLNNLPKSTPHPTVNGAILVECKTLRHVVASAAEAETAGVFHNAQTAIPIRTILKALGHPQPPTPVKTDNSTTNGFIHNNIHLKKSKSWDMRYHWLRDKEAQRLFQFYWDRGSNNNADYYTKHHPTYHHKSMRNTYVQDKINIIIQRLNQLENMCTARVC